MTHILDDMEDVVFARHVTFEEVLEGLEKMEEKAGTPVSLTLWSNGLAEIRRQKASQALEYTNPVEAIHEILRVHK